MLNINATSVSNRFLFRQNVLRVLSKYMARVSPDRAISIIYYIRKLGLDWKDLPEADRISFLVRAKSTLSRSGDTKNNNQVNSIVLEKIFE